MFIDSLTLRLAKLNLLRYFRHKVLKLKKYTFSFLFIGLFTTVILVQSCTSDSISDIEPLDMDCELENVTYSGQIRAIINLSCATPGCHTAGDGNGNYEDFTGIERVIDNGRFEDRVFVQRDMPPDGVRLTDCVLEQLQVWIDNGALNN